MKDGLHVGQQENPAQGFQDRKLTVAQVLAFLTRAAMEVQGLLPWSSNYTFLVRVKDGTWSSLAVYKPRAGETPLWDFPQGTLCLREYAAFLVSEALGWRLVPPTVLRNGPHGFGMVQLFVDADREEHYFTMRGRFTRQFQRVAVFDYVVNNADRKSGHVLRDAHDHIWVIDHGITFHEEHKLRTVIWDFAGEPIPGDILGDLAALEEQVAAESPLLEALSRLLTDAEIGAFRRRLRHLLDSTRFPHPGPGRHMPWPLV